MDIFGLLKEAAGKENVLLNEPMKNHTSFRTGGNADYFITPADTDSLIKVMKVIKASGMDCLIFGNGSNMLVSDRGIEGAVIHIGKNFSDIEIVKDGMIIGSGALLSAASAEALNNGLSGMEFASGIPGSFGGAVYMNAGAYGSEIKNIVKWVKVLDSNFEEQLFCGDELCLGYRSSVFQKGGYIILEGMVELSKGDKDDIGALMNELNAKRRQKQPLNFASAGSTFKRPEGCFA